MHRHEVTFFEARVNFHPERRLVGFKTAVVAAARRLSVIVVAFSSMLSLLNSPLFPLCRRYESHELPHRSGCASEAAM
jgi:hypothetical protein